LGDKINDAVSNQQQQSKMQKETLLPAPATTGRWVLFSAALSMDLWVCPTK